jgi:hypothetical protein
MIITVLVSLPNAKIYGLLRQLFVIQLMEKFFVVPERFYRHHKNWKSLVSVQSTCHARVYNQLYGDIFNSYILVRA